MCTHTLTRTVFSLTNWTNKEALDAPHKCSTFEVHIREERTTQTAGFIRSLDRLCTHQWQPDSYQFPSSLHRWPDYSKRDTVKDKGVVCGRSVVKNADAQMGRSDRHFMFLKGKPQLTAYIVSDCTKTNDATVFTAVNWTDWKSLYTVFFKINNQKKTRVVWVVRCGVFTDHLHTSLNAANHVFSRQREQHKP